MNTDRELLELAAKAAGMNHILSFKYHDDCGLGGWNPLSDDGDALRLAVNLSITNRGLDLLLWPDRVVVYWDRATPSARPSKRELHDADPYAATRRAIVRAAAEIGRTMQQKDEK